jgi:hypothetical protein
MQPRHCKYATKPSRLRYPAFQSEIANRKLAGVDELGSFAASNDSARCGTWVGILFIC